MSELVIIFALISCFFVALRLKALAWLAARPLITVASASVVGLVWQGMSINTPDAELMRHAARFGLAMLGFFAALQCRVSRLAIRSPAAFRLASLAPIAFLALFTVTGFIVVPGLGILSALLIGAAVMLAGAPNVAAPLLTAPIETETKATARLESSATLCFALPLALLIEAGATPSIDPVHLQPLFKTLAGFAVGGGMGLIAGRLLPISSGPLPVMPGMVALACYGAAVYTTFDPVMATVAGGVLYSEETKLRADVRTRLWRVSEGLISPIAFIGLGLLLAPLLLQVQLLGWVAAAFAIFGARACARFAALQRMPLASQDQNFLIWFGGAPGAATALFLISLTESASPVISDQALALGVAVTILGIAATRLHSRPLTSRLVQATARARKRRYVSA